MSAAGDTARLARAATLLAVAAVGSRALGLVREIVVAALFGAADAKAAFVIGYYLPFFVQRLLISGTLSIVLIPTLTEVLARGDAGELRRVTTYLFTAVVGVGLVMVAAGVLLAPGLVPLAAPGFLADPAQLARTVALTRINFVAMFFLALAVFATAYLHAQRRFAVPAVAPLAFNLTIIGATLWLGPAMGIAGLAAAWVAGTAVQFLVQVPALRAAGFRAGLGLDWSHPAIRTVRRLAVPAMLGLAIVEINAYVGRLLASLLPVAPGVHPVAALDYAYEVVQAPIGILAISVATVLFPGMSQQAAAGDRSGLREASSAGLRGIVFLTLPVSAALVIFAAPVVRVIFERGEFGPDATGVVAACLAAYAVGLVPMSAYYVLTRTYYAMQDMRTPVVVGGGMVALNAALAYGLMRLAGVAGIALASAVVAFVNVGILLGLVRGRLGSIEGRRLARTVGAVSVATAVALAVGRRAMGVVPAGAGIPAAVGGGVGVAIALAVGLGSAAAIYLAACAVLRVDEIGLLRSLLRRGSGPAAAGGSPDGTPAGTPGGTPSRGPGGLA